MLLPARSRFCGPCKTDCASGAPECASGLTRAIGAEKMQFRPSSSIGAWGRRTSFQILQPLSVIGAVTSLLPTAAIHHRSSIRVWRGGGPGKEDGYADAFIWLRFNIHAGVSILLKRLYN